MSGPTSSSRSSRRRACGSCRRSATAPSTRPSLAYLLRQLDTEAADPHRTGHRAVHPLHRARRLRAPLPGRRAARRRRAHRRRARQGGAAHDGGEHARRDRVRRRSASTDRLGRRTIRVGLQFARRHRARFADFPSVAHGGSDTRRPLWRNREQACRSTSVAPLAARTLASCSPACPRSPVFVRSSRTTCCASRTRPGTGSTRCAPSCPASTRSPTSRSRCATAG